MVFAESGEVKVKIVEELYNRAIEIVGRISLNGFPGNSAGAVSCALRTKGGKIYTGICIDVACSLGFCAEHAAIAEMLKAHETEISMIVAVNETGKILPPCGRCRELLVQVDKRNLNTQVVIDKNKIIMLNELHPEIWVEKF